jgi:hypothetical protein
MAIGNRCAVHLGGAGRNAVRAILALVVLVRTDPATAAMLSYEITGYVTEIQSLGTPVPNSVVVAPGDLLHARFDFDPSGSEAFPGAAFSASYPILLGWELTLGPLQAQASPVLVPSEDYISRGGRAGTSANIYQVHAQQEHRGGATRYDSVRVLISLDDSGQTGGVFDRSLILESSGFADFERQRFFIDHYGYLDDVNFSSSTAIGVITSITVVPEPSSLTLLGLGLLLLSRFNRSRSS